MRLLDRYLLRELLIPLGYCLGGFLIFWISFDLFAKLSDFQEEKLPLGIIARYYAARTPEFLVLVVPIALLLALLYALGNHARHHELTAIRAAGIGLFRLSAPYLATGFFLSLALLALNELWVPRSSDRANALREENRAKLKKTPVSRWEYNLHFRNGRDGRIWNIGALNLDTFTMRNPQVSWRLPDQSRCSLIATNAIRTNGNWAFFSVVQFTYPPGSEFTNTVTSTPYLEVPEFSESPAQILSEIKIGRLRALRAARDTQLSAAEMINYLRLHPDLEPRDDLWLRTQLHARLAAPWTCLVVVFITLPFAARNPRRNAFVGVAASIFICFAYFVLLRLGLALGTGGAAPPWLAAWLPNLVFAGLGAGLAWRGQ